MSISERITGTIENWRKLWGEALKSFMVRIVSYGLEVFMDVIGKAFAPKLKPLIDAIEETGKVPPELQPILDEMKTPAGEVSAILSQAGGGAMMSGAVSMILEQLFADVARAFSSKMRKTWIDLPRVMESWRRGKIPDEQLTEFLKFAGFPDPQHELLKELTTIRLDPMSIVTAWRRDPETYAHLFDDLKDQGWTDERIEALKFVTLYYPAPPDLVRWQAREVFEPAMIERYGLDSEFEAIDKAPFYKAGMTDEQILNYWRAHWEHASWMQIVEMLHRGLLTEEEVYDWFRLVEIPPFWRDLLIQTAYTWPTRVDVRRWWDMRTIGETELRRLYSGMGYRGDNLDNYVKWTKVYVAFPDLMARWTKGWINLDEVRSELTALGMPAERLEEFIQMKVKAEQPERTSAERDITKTDIIKGVRQGVITRDEGIEILQDLGYDYDEAVYILEINIPRDQEDVVVSARKISKADVLKGLKAEVLTSAEALTRLIDLRYSAADAALLLKIYEDQVEPPKELKQREASKADIVLGVKKGLIDQSEGYAMLLDLDFTPEAASFILMVKTEESPFSPINYPEFKELTHKYRIASGREARPMTEELKAAADEVVKLTGEVEALTKSVEIEKRKLIKGEVVPEATTKKLTALEGKLHRAQSELARVKTEYNIKLAEWRHG